MHKPQQCPALCYFPGTVREQLSMDGVTFSKSLGYLQAVAFGLPGAALGFWWAMIAGVGVVALPTSLRLRVWLS